MGQLIDKLKKRWGLDSLWQLVLVLFIFSITGFTTLYVKKIFFGWFGFTDNTPFLLRSAAWLFTVLPSYQILFLLYGFILGQFEFVWRFEKKSWEKLKKLWKRREPQDG